ncbi:protein ROOT INITIATION DEFECTIVE 3-like [Cornus florida]|uniref:protein ROOT INITIATION DEFECTIVE 3-like n=1 Tax=Cornus florida TaxID=4283 RepID=UPI00289E73DF|nr:protein ROOT INITIATION DEFECTIVE 3-like [Cornus florida]
MGSKEALVVCSDKKLSTGITIWDMDTGDDLYHIPTCASPPHALTCLRNQYLVASQIHRQGSFGSGAIFIWPLNKPQAPLRNYPIEAIGPVSCTKDGVYLAGGTLSGNAYIWEVINGRLLKNWCAHLKSVTCLVFSDDGTLLISGSEDGTIIVWPMISLLDETDCGSFPSMLSFSAKHTSSVTRLLSTSSSSSSVFLSSSLDGTCKVWDLVTGTLLGTRAFSHPITAIVLDPLEKILFSGSEDGRIFVNALDIGGVEDPFDVSENQPIVLNGHKGSITVLTFSASGLISASEDCTACLWDVVNCVIIRRFNHLKGSITNLVVIPHLSLLPVMNHRQRASNQFRVSSLDKLPRPTNSSKGMVTLLPSCSSLKVQHFTSEFRSTDSMNQQILELENGWTQGAIQMKVEKSIEGRVWASRMTKHLIKMNKHLQSRLLDLVQCQLLPLDSCPPPTGKGKKLKVESLPLQEEEQTPSPAS